MEEFATLEYFVPVILEIRNLLSAESLAFTGEIKIPKLRDSFQPSSSEDSTSVRERNRSCPVPGVKVKRA